METAGENRQRRTKRDVGEMDGLPGSFLLASPPAGITRPRFAFSAWEFHDLAARIRNAACSRQYPGSKSGGPVGFHGLEFSDGVAERIGERPARTSDRKPRAVRRSEVFFRPVESRYIGSRT